MVDDIFFPSAGKGSNLQGTGQLPIQDRRGPTESASTGLWPGARGESSFQCEDRITGTT